MKYIFIFVILSLSVVLLPFNYIYSQLEKKSFITLAEQLYNIPVDLSFDQSGNLYVLNSGRRYIQIFDAHGRFIKDIGKNSLGRLRGLQPFAIDVSRNNIIYVLNHVTKQIVEINYFGKLYKILNFDFWVNNLKILRNGDLLLLGNKSNHIFHVYNKNGNYLYSFGNAFQPPNKKFNWQMAGPMEFYINRDTIYVASNFRYEIQRYVNKKLNWVYISNDSLKIAANVKSSKRGIEISFPSGISGIVECGNLLYVSLFFIDKTKRKYSNYQFSFRTINHFSRKFFFSLSKSSFRHRLYFAINFSCLFF